MKQKASISLSSDLLKEVDRSAGSKASRSAFIENVLREYFKTRVRDALNARDAALINAHADYLNREMEDALRYSAPISYEQEN